MLLDDGVGSCRPVPVHLRHVEIVQEIYQRLVGLRAVVLARLLLQMFLDHPLGGLGRVVEVERYVGGDVRLPKTA